MAKGFSFVLVCVVMVTMLVFGMLSLSGAGADLRLARKGAVAQQAYYSQDTRGETFYAEAQNAAFKAQASAELLVSGDAALPADFFSGFDGGVRGRAQSTDSRLLCRAAFYYYLGKELGAIRDVKVTAKTDGNAVALFASGANPSGTVVTACADIAENSRTLHVALACGSADLTRTPEFRVTDWSWSAQGLSISSGQHIDVWDGT